MLETDAASLEYEICTASTDRSRWHFKVSALLDYWSMISPPGCLPGRQHLDPMSIPALLPSIWLLDLVGDPVRFRFRVFGTHLVSFLKAEFTGRFLHEVHASSPNLPHVEERLNRVVNDRVAIYSKAEVALVTDKEFVIAEALHLPLARDGRNVDMILAISIFIARSTGKAI